MPTSEDVSAVVRGAISSNSSGSTGGVLNNVCAATKLVLATSFRL